VEWRITRSMSLSAYSSVDRCITISRVSVLPPVHRGCLIPDHLLLEIARRGDRVERTGALDSLALSGSLRSARGRAEVARLRTGVPAAGGALGPPGRERVVRDGGGRPFGPAPVVRGEDDPPTGDRAVDQVFSHLGTTWDFFFEIYARNSVDNAGAPVDAVVRYGERYTNAFWDGARMVFGDGDGWLLRGLTGSLTVCGHEFGHAVVQADGPLLAAGQPGALGEHLADAFAAMVHQWRHRETAETADWLIGAEVLGPGVNGVALRSMRDPGTAYDDPVLGTDPQPAHVNDYVLTGHDNGGVHINSGIPNRAFYEIAAAVGGDSWRVAGRILYATLGHPQLRPTSDFRQFARLEHRVAGQLYGPAGPEAAAVRAGWKAVGIEL
jgi:Zn-dependent metalloprotease